MNEVITIGVDLAKNVFQVHGVDADGAVLFRRQLRRRQVLALFKKQPPPAWLVWRRVRARITGRGRSRRLAMRSS